MAEEELKEIEILQDEVLAKGGPTKGKPLVGADPDKVARLKELLDKQADEGDAPEESSTPEIMPDPVIQEEKNRKKIKLARPADKKKECSEDIIALEREIRRYVKKTGGFRRDISDEAKREGKRLLEIAGRKEVKWNERINVPGYDR